MQNDSAAELAQEAAFRLCHEGYGVPAAKLNVAAGFYGRTFKVASLYGPHQGADVSTFLADEASLCTSIS